MERMTPMRPYHWHRLTAKSRWKAIWRDIRAHQGRWPAGVTYGHALYKLAAAVYHARQQGGPGLTLGDAPLAIS
jgi:hypothetical protein